MAGWILKTISAWITKELLLDLFRDVFVDYALDEVREYVRDTETSADDKLLAEFEDWYAKRYGKGE